MGQPWSLDLKTTTEPLPRRSDQSPVESLPHFHLWFEKEVEGSRVTTVVGGRREYVIKLCWKSVESHKSENFSRTLNMKGERRH